MKTTLSSHHPDIVAIVLSAVPGLGQIYKGYYGEGVSLLIADLLLAIWTITLLSLSYVAQTFLGAFGVSASWAELLFNPITIVFCWAPIALLELLSGIAAFEEPDRRGAHHRHVPQATL